MNETVLRDLHSCLHAEHRHLTAKAVAIEHSLPRSIVSSLLESLPYYDTSKECDYEITRCILSKDDNKVVATLVTTIETIGQGDEKPHSNDSIHSISLSLPSSGSESTIAAHMKTLSLVNDDPDIILDPEIACDVIDPASVVEKLDKDTIRMNRFKGKSKAKIADSNKPAAQKSTQSRPKIATKKKVTSAATFFKSEKTQTTKSKKIQTIKGKKSVTEKVSVMKKDKPKAGNADDFVGDVDEDEEFLKGEEERKKRNAANESKRSQKNKKRESDSRAQPKRMAMADDDSKKSTGDDVESEGNKKAKHGAMDTFATKRDRVEEKPQQQGKKKRKQMLEEKTFADESGFLRTEIVSVWKEVEEDIAAPVPATNKAASSSKQKPKANSSKNMKQQGLMGFFGAKK
uniref:DNA polymerase delta subunit 3 n=1 Tax=Chaetoceros debilis TaxID=122233 RepID=A0A7S3PUG6_9STRA|mmetsp:Transcript_15692/g.23501  ORF Transcript_15692/g.23501 Transcript_15692/m.23501 type:complete len:402 (+) Transcript_15692:142-1347(+)|eukprot:CAMPEP_0194093524 /NCGR_PEP_ID=MMETSP0149-20130528/50732_1 /TAXON_ID=122233 /ORGANISM="Chaetoceros debilis, Strain MM31A-1" /LENGTH=401 /DNA_ID=CAMNT_0038778861 /DNA_START=169 /DNA_END=1374 /DNA_ORIENTATION=+